MFDFLKHYKNQDIIGTDDLLLQVHYEGMRRNFLLSEKFMMLWQKFSKAKRKKKENIGHDIFFNLGILHDPQKPIPPREQMIFTSDVKQQHFRNNSSVFRLKSAVMITIRREFNGCPFEENVSVLSLEKDFKRITDYLKGLDKTKLEEEKRRLQQTIINGGLTTPFYPNFYKAPNIAKKEFMIAFNFFYDVYYLIGREKVSRKQREDLRGKYTLDKFPIWDARYLEKKTRPAIAKAMKKKIKYNGPLSPSELNSMIENKEENLLKTNDQRCKQVSYIISQNIYPPSSTR